MTLLIKEEEKYENLPSTINNEEFCEKISVILTEILVETEKMAEKKITLFDAKAPAKISIRDYLHRIMKFTFCSQESVISAIIYLDKIFNWNEGLVLTENNAHRFMFLGIIIAVKFFEDKYYKNEYYAKVGGVSLKELNCLEIEFLKFIDFNLFISLEVFDYYKQKILEK